MKITLREYKDRCAVLSMPAITRRIRENRKLEYVRKIEKIGRMYLLTIGSKK